jgi:hypothetical protein
MKRRLSTLCILLLGLSGVIPAAVACAFVTQSTDCCHMGQSCETGGAAAIVASVRATCCVAQPDPARSTVTADAQSERRFADSPPPDRAAVPAFEFPNSLHSLRERTAVAVAPPFKVNQQLVYLRTGRLRL